ncbi:hypothetical protein HYFRA_00005246 [Hymenoscyphus fraxineus]|uniref:Methyltransferase domain-containing protein n=1 Tax=Hymenoscyphus fraxineus TaxID=746836 RepID=A0A9N9PPP3_9HELO|nr:hypothetical protein HYFRA_00005246 [Hymenoscyphus fraxineus]
MALALDQTPEFWNRRSDGEGERAYDISNSSYPCYHYQDLEEVITLVPNDLSNLNIVDLGCGTGELVWRLLEKGNPNVLGVDFSHSMIKKARDPETEKKATKKALDEAKQKVEKTISELSVALFLRGTSTAEVHARLNDEKTKRMKALEEEFEAHTTMLQARKATKTSKQQTPTFVQGDITKDECMKSILDHFGGPNINLICVIWVLRIVAFDNAIFIRNKMVELIRKWASLLAPGGTLLIQYDHHEKHFDLLLAPSSTQDKPSFRLPNGNDVSECKDQLEGIASEVGCLKLESVYDAHARYPLISDTTLKVVHEDETVKSFLASHSGASERDAVLKYYEGKKWMTESQIERSSVYAIFKKL